MSKLKKIALAISIFLIVILGFTTLVKAATPLNTEFKDEHINIVNEEELFRNLNLFCLVREAQPPYGGYDRFAHIKIEGNLATNEDNKKTWSSEDNAKLAYMLNFAKKIPMDGLVADKTSTLRALGWVFFPTWWEDAKTKLGISGDIRVEGCKIDDLEEAKEEYEKLEIAANKYASSYQGSEIQKQETGKNVTVTSTIINNIQYYKIGPFKCKFSNPLEDISVNTNNGNYTPSMCIQNGESINISQIESEKNFYINIAADKNITSINYITIKGKEVVTYSADLYIYKKDSTDIDDLQNQNFAYFTKRDEHHNPEVKYELNLSIDGELKIRKVDTSTKNQVNGIGFKVYSQVAGKTGWLQIDKDGKITDYTTFENATELVTDYREGLAGYTEKIIGMPVGKYTIYETNLGPHSNLYTLGTCEVSKGTNINEKITVTAKKIEEKDIYGTYIAKAENTPVLGSLNITKIDVNSQEKLNNVGFKIYSNVKGKTGWLLIDEEKWELKGYTTFDKATEVYTKTIGEVKGITETIKKLPAGEYEVYETNIDKYQDLYVLDEMKVTKGAEGSNKITRKAKKVATKTVEAKGVTETATVEAKNKKELGSLIIHKVDKSGNPLKGIGFKIYSEVPGKEGWLNINNGTGLVESYVGKIEEVKYDLKTGSDGNTHIVTRLPAGKYKIYETGVGKYSDLYDLTLTDVPGGTKAYVKNIGEVEVKATGTAEATLHTETNTPDLGSLKIKKIDKYTGATLPYIGFKVYSNVENKEGWLIINTDNELTGYANFSQASEIFTTENGITNIIKKLPAGEYSVYETNIENYRATYKLEEIEVPGVNKKVKAKSVGTQTVEAKGTAESTLYEAENIPQLVNLSGYVWLDKQSQKQSVRNNLFNEDDNDDADLKLQGIKVILQQEELTGGGWMVGEDISNSAHYYTIAETTTDANGAYKFENIKVSDLSNSAIVFEYDGLTYTNVVPNLKKNNGSKAAENEYDREKFNNKFEKIEYDTTINGVKLEYDNTEAHKSKFINNSQFVINAETSEARFYLETEYKEGRFEYNADGIPEIKNINLGLYKREQPDLAVVKDIDNVRITVNGYEHMYKYSSRFKNAGEYLDGFNVGVKFGEKYGNQSYSRPVYKADYDYENLEDKNKELKAYITYAIAIRNEATDLTSKVYSLVDYYDSRYTLVDVGTELGKDGNITGTRITHTDSSYNDQYKQSILETSCLIDSKKDQYIYVQFSMDKETIFNIINGKELLYNVVEINSYSTYKEDKLYAGIDKDSRPGNAIPGNKDTYEDDTDAAPALGIDWAEARKITGTVFEDSVTGEIKAGEERLGDGIYTDGEKTISGVTVNLVKEDGNIEKTAVTDENGNFELSGFMPGNYTIVYTWGDSTYTVDDYKGTIYKEPERLTNPLWFNEKVDTRYSDAIDNYDTRILIDSGEHTEITTMDSSTPAIKFGIEMTDLSNEESIPLTPGIDKVEFLIKNIDFGIVERPRQKIDISKEVTAIKTTVGEIELVNVKKEDGTFVPVANGATINIKNFIVTPPDKDTQKSKIKEELDSDLLNNATVEIEYTITVANNSELDYDSEDYYKYGKKTGNKVVVKPVGVYDYLDKEMALNPDKADENAKWTKVESTKYTETIKNTPTITDEYLIKYGSIDFDELGNKIEINGFKSCVEEYLGEKIEEWETSVLTTFRQKMVADKTILHNEDLEGELEAGDKKEVKLYTSTKLSASGEIDLNNSAEITKVERNTTTGRKVTPRTSKLFDSGEQVVVTPPTGENHDYVLPIALGVSVLVILGAGVILIKKKVLNK